MDAEATILPRDLVPLSKAAHLAEVSEQTFRKYIQDGLFTPYRKGIRNPESKHDYRPIFIDRAELTFDRLFEVAQ